MTDRQQGIKDHFIESAQQQADEIPTALIGLTVQPNGHIRSIALQVEPEHVLPVLSAMRQLTERLESYLTESLTGRALLVVAGVAALVVADSLAAPALASLIDK